MYICIVGAGDLWLEYNTVVPCGVDEDTTSFMRSKIFFVCNPEATVAETTNPATYAGYVSLVSNLGGCEFIFEYETALACPPPQPVACVLQDPVTGETYDLSPLAKPTGAWEVAVGGGSEGDAYTYLLNLCMPIVSDLCATPGQGACQVQVGADGSAAGAKGLGVPSAPVLSTTESGVPTIVVEYVGGATCHRTTDNRHARSTYLNLYCDQAHGIGEPTFLAENDCAYNFEWYTSAACPLSNTTVVGTDCSVRDAATGRLFNFTSLALPTSDYIVDGGSGFQYAINICRKTKQACHGTTASIDLHSGACQLKPGEASFHPKSLGDFNASLEVNANSIDLVYDGGPLCSSGAHRSSQISFVCPVDGQAENNVTFLGEDDNCTYFFEFHTSLACVQEPIQCVVNDPATGKVFDFTELMSTDPTKGNYAVANPENGHVYEINICNSILSDGTGEGEC